MKQRIFYRIKKKLNFFCFVEPGGQGHTCTASRLIIFACEERKSSSVPSLPIIASNEINQDLKNGLMI